MKMYIISMGKLTNDINLSFAHATLATQDNRSPEAKWHDSPCYAVLIDHPTAGYILYDLGSPADANDRWPKSVINSCYYTGSSEMTMTAQLAKIGLKPEDIKHVVMSHMHMDHIGNIDLFKDTAEFYVARAEAANAFLTVQGNPDPATHGFYNKADVLTEVKKINYLDEESEIFEGIETLFLPGHTPCVLGLVVHLTDDKTVILTSDAVNARRNYEGNLPGVIYDSMGFHESIKKIKAAEKKYDADVWFGHDMEQFNAFKKVPEFYE